MKKKSKIPGYDLAQKFDMIRRHAEMYEYRACMKYRENPDVIWLRIEKPLSAQRQFVRRLEILGTESDSITRQKLDGAWSDIFTQYRLNR